MRTLCHDLARSIPNIIRINRGKLSLIEIAEKALENNADKVVIVDRWKGGPGKIRFFKVNSTGLKAIPPLIYIKGIRLQRTFEKAKAKPVRSLGLIPPSKKTKQTSKVARFISEFFVVSMIPTEEDWKKFQAAITVSLDSMKRMRISFLLLPKKIEIGPRITVSHVIWEI
jgi:rRNA maturation protein Rpf1